MTGFARASGGGAAAWSWEVRSVNGRALDVRCRLPQGLERLDPAVRSRVAARLRRGNVTVGLRLGQAPDAAALRVNRSWLDELVALAADYRGREDLAPPRLDGLLALRGVIEPAETPEDDADGTRHDAAMLETLDTALAELVRERRAEGAQLAAALNGPDRGDRGAHAAGRGTGARASGGARRTASRTGGGLDRRRLRRCPRSGWRRSSPCSPSRST